MDIVQGNVGSEAKYEVDVVGKNLVVKFDYKGKELSSSHSAELDLVAILEKIKVAIPGTIDDAIISAVQGFLTAKP